MADDDSAEEEFQRFTSTVHDMVQVLLPLSTNTALLEHIAHKVNRHEGVPLRVLVRSMRALQLKPSFMNDIEGM